MAILAACAGAYSLYQRLEFAAIASLIFLAAVIYKAVATRAISTGMGLLSNVTNAKYKDLEVSVGREHLGLTLATSAPAGMSGLLSSMTSGQIGRLMAVTLAGGEDIVVSTALTDLRGLRRLGLVQESGPTMAQSDTVLLTPLGQTVSDYLLAPPPPPTDRPKADLSSPTGSGRHETKELLEIAESNADDPATAAKGGQLAGDNAKTQGVDADAENASRCGQ